MIKAALLLETETHFIVENTEELDDGEKWSSSRIYMLAKRCMNGSGKFIRRHTREFFESMVKADWKVIHVAWLNPPQPYAEVESFNFFCVKEPRTISCKGGGRKPVICFLITSFLNEQKGEKHLFFREVEDD